VIIYFDDTILAVTGD